MAQYYFLQAPRAVFCLAAGRIGKRFLELALTKQEQKRCAFTELVLLHHA